MHSRTKKWWTGLAGTALLSLMLLGAINLDARGTDTKQAGFVDQVVSTATATPTATASSTVAPSATPSPEPTATPIPPTAVPPTEVPYVPPQPTAIPYVAPAPAVVSSGTLSAAAVGDLARAAGFGEWAVPAAVEIARCESGFNTGATGSQREMGLWQIHPRWHADATYDPLGNAIAAHRISGGGVDWTAWTTSSVLATGVCP